MVYLGGSVCLGMVTGSNLPEKLGGLLDAGMLADRLSQSRGRPAPVGSSGDDPQSSHPCRGSTPLW